MDDYGIAGVRSHQRSRNHVLSLPGLEPVALAQCRDTHGISSGERHRMHERSKAVIVWGGDVNLGRRLHYRAAQSEGPVLDVPALREADLAIVNLECVVSRIGRLGVRKGEAAPYYFRARPEMLGVLRDAGVDVVTTANNHSGDYGPEALMDQERWLATAGIGSVGSGANEKQAFAPIFRRAGPYAVAIFSIDATQRFTAAGSATPGQAYLPPADPSRWADAIAPLLAHARQFADVVLIAVHAGRNFAAEPEPQAAAIAYALVDAGADAVLGSSAHVLQGVEIYKGRPIIHDAGDLLFDAVSRSDDDGGLFSLHVGPAGIEKVGFTPLHVGFGHTRARMGEDAQAAVRRFIDKSQHLGTVFEPQGDGTAILNLAPDTSAMKWQQPSGHEVDTVPQADWTVTSLPPDTALDQPCTLGPLKLLGARAAPLALERRGMIYVETFWTLDEPVADDWRIEVRAIAQGDGEPTLAWGADSDHDPCDWMLPTSRWRAGIIYRDHCGLRPPPHNRLRSATLGLAVRVVKAGQRHPWVRLPLTIKFAIQPTNTVAQVAETTSQRPTAQPTYKPIDASALPPRLPGLRHATWTADELLAATRGRWLTQPPTDWHVQSVVRYKPHLSLLPSPALLVACDYQTLAFHEQYSQPKANTTWDTHGDVPTLAQRLAGALVARPIPDAPPTLPQLLVEDPIQAMIELGAVARQRLSGPVVAVTGSAGKSSTCAMLHHAFQRKYRVTSSIDNYNSRVGMLATLACVPPDCELTLLEVAVSAINSRGFQHIRLVKPDLAIITNIAAAHLRPGETTRDVALRKAHIFRGMEAGSWALICADSDHANLLIQQARAQRLRIMTYGEHPRAHVLLQAYDPGTGKVQARRANGQEIDFVVGARGRHMAINSLACLAAADALGFDFSVESASLHTFQAIAGRGQVRDAHSGEQAFRLVDESYNANPLSMKAALAAFASASTPARKILALGDMLELGSESPRLHRELAGPVLAAAPARIFLIGEHMKELAQRIGEIQPQQAIAHVDTIDTMLQALRSELRNGDLLLIKGSHSMQLAKIVKHFAACVT